MIKKNKNGFIISTTLYGIFGIMLITVFYILYVLATNRTLLNNDIKSVKNDLSSNKILVNLIGDRNIIDNIANETYINKDDIEFNLNYKSETNEKYCFNESIEYFNLYSTNQEDLDKIEVEIDYRNLTSYYSDYSNIVYYGTDINGNAVYGYDHANNCDSSTLPHPFFGAVREYLIYNIENLGTNVSNVPTSSVDSTCSSCCNLSDFDFKTTFSNINEDNWSIYTDINYTHSVTTSIGGILRPTTTSGSSKAYYTKNGTSLSSKPNSTVSTFGSLHKVYDDNGNEITRPTVKLGYGGDKFDGNIIYLHSINDIDNSGISTRTSDTHLDDENIYSKEVNGEIKYGIYVPILKDTYDYDLDNFYSVMLWFPKSTLIPEPVCHDEVESYKYRYDLTLKGSSYYNEYTLLFVDTLYELTDLGDTLKETIENPSIKNKYIICNEEDTCTKLSDKYGDISGVKIGNVGDLNNYNDYKNAIIKFINSL